jgi:ferredoxin
MPLWFARGLRRGVVTTRYPARSDPSAALLPTPPAFRPRKLTRELVDVMISVCPGPALSRADDTLVVDLGACTACGRCARVAPQAVTPSGEFELAATARPALIKLIPILGGDR